MIYLQCDKTGDLMNQYTANLNRIEFVITYACTGRCKHCSEGDHNNTGEHIDAGAAAEAVRKIAERYRMDSLMTFGGEPLLYPEAVYAIHVAAKEMKIPKRQLITNGFFTRDKGKIRDVAGKLAQSGVNDVCLSVDAFHQETIPLEPVMEFALEIKRPGIRLRTHPAWLVEKGHDNAYNRRTAGILAEFENMGIMQSDGNIIFPGGNALKYLRDYFDPDKEYISPYEEDPADIRAVCINPNGDVLNGNLYRTDIRKILQEYVPA